MEDIDLNISKPGTILYKQFLNLDIVNEIKQWIDENKTGNLHGLIGHRDKLDNIPMKFKESITEVLNQTLGTQYPDLKIGYMRIYVQQFGSIKPHTDISSDGKSNVTCLIYLTDGYEGGELNIKVKRTDLSIEPEKKHF